MKRKDTKHVEQNDNSKQDKKNAHFFSFSGLRRRSANTQENGDDSSRESSNIRTA
ncbi:hypothetical protein [Kistimonas scapharcae]|uniref:hypothetical protein n=1 Tax=Kistimonas scapharcae TaxID=1036133 RepID=UPI0031E85032